MKWFDIAFACCESHMHVCQHYQWLIRVTWTLAAGWYS
jgi:hypothetical protein